ncbi:MAG: PTS transporter subunit EIIC [Culicoidibacterales bacterium]
MAKNNDVLAKKILVAVGGADNVQSLTHCMTRLRFKLKNVALANKAEIKQIAGVIGCIDKGGQFQIIIGTTVDEVCQQLYCLLPHLDEQVEQKHAKRQDYSPKGILNTVFDYLAGSLTPLIPILIVASLFKTLAAVLGPALFGLVSAESDLYVLFSFVGDAGFYFLPIFAGYSAAKKFGCNPYIAMLLGAVFIHPTLMGILTDEVAFSVYGIPATLQNYSNSIVPIILTVWAMTYVERILTKISPDVLKIFLIPFGTALIMLPLQLTVLGPLGSFIGVYLCEAIVWFYELAGPLGVGLIGAFFALLVMSGMHIVLVSTMFMTFPILGYDSMLTPGVLASSWVSAGVAIACVWKFKQQENKTLTLGYLLTWFFGGVGEPLLYGLHVRYKTPLYASIIAGFISGAVAGFLNLSAYTLTAANGIYGLTAFVGGPTSNYVALAITIAVSLVSGIGVMMLFNLSESKVRNEQATKVEQPMSKVVEA